MTPHDLAKSGSEIPDGFVLVPIEPTEAMLEAYKSAARAYAWYKGQQILLSKHEQRDVRNTRLSEDEKAKARWKAMIMAAQQ